MIYSRIVGSGEFPGQLPNPSVQAKKNMRTIASTVRFHDESYAYAHFEAKLLAAKGKCWIY